MSTLGTSRSLGCWASALGSWRPPRPECMDILCTEKKFSLKLISTSSAILSLELHLGKKLNPSCGTAGCSVKTALLDTESLTRGDGPLPPVPLPDCLRLSVCLSLWSSCLSVCLFHKCSSSDSVCTSPLSLSCL